MPTSRIRAALITGATGSGKTTVIRGVLAQRPSHERWAVLVNDFGTVTLADSDPVAVREVSGCICCTAHVLLRTALVSLLREVRPQRVLIEASAAARPAALMAVLSEPGLADALELATTVCVVSAHQLSDPRYMRNDVYREQIAAADSIAITGEDDGGAAVRASIDTLRSTAPRYLDELHKEFWPRERAK